MDAGRRGREGPQQGRNEAEKDRHRTLDRNKKEKSEEKIEAREAKTRKTRKMNYLAHEKKFTQTKKTLDKGLRI